MWKPVSDRIKKGKPKLDKTDEERAPDGDHGWCRNRDRFTKHRYKDPCVGADPPLWQSVPHEEYQVYSTGLRRPDTTTAVRTQTQTPMSNALIPAQFDWRTVLGDIPVRNQEGCGSCWAFAHTVYSLENVPCLLHWDRWNFY